MVECLCWPAGPSVDRRASTPSTRHPSHVQSSSTRTGRRHRTAKLMVLYSNISKLTKVGSEEIAGRSEGNGVIGRNYENTRLAEDGNGPDTPRNPIAFKQQLWTPPSRRPARTVGRSRHRPLTVDPSRAPRRRGPRPGAGRTPCAPLWSRPVWNQECVGCT